MGMWNHQGKPFDPKMMYLTYVGRCRCSSLILHMHWAHPILAHCTQTHYVADADGAEDQPRPRLQIRIEIVHGACDRLLTVQLGLLDNVNSICVSIFISLNCDLYQTEKK